MGVEGPVQERAPVRPGVDPEVLMGGPVAAGHVDLELVGHFLLHPGR
jgi:hypothetical protein